MNGTIHCPQCGQPMTLSANDPRRQLVCGRCHHAFVPAASMGHVPVPTTGEPPKSKITAGLLGIFLGGLGVHRFYLGYTGIGIVQVITTLVGGAIGCFCFPTAAIGPIWGLIEGILCLTGSMKDVEGRELVD